MKRRLRIFGIFLGIFLCALLLFGLSSPRRHTIGFTYSTVYAQYLGLDPVSDFEEILGYMPFEFVRIPVYWDRYESLNDLWQFEELQSLLDIASRHNVGVILAIGQKVPRWPECFVPDWAETLDQSTYEQEFLEFTSQVLERFAQHPTVERWQVENESYFPFGECAPADPKLIKKETRLVRELAPGRPIQTTVSGEQSIGLIKTAFSDIIGLSLYRSVAVPSLGKYTFPHTPLFYRVQKGLVRLGMSETVISELQAEPWGLHEFDITTPEGLDAAYHAFTEKELEEQLRFAQRTGITEISVWGVEWWLALARQGESRLWQGAQRILESL